MIIKLPSGREVDVRVMASEPSANATPGVRRVVNALPIIPGCVHLGAPLNGVKPGCRGVAENAPWSCEIYGKCLPLARSDREQGIALCARCPDYVADSGPSLTNKAFNYASAVTRWKLAGSPVRTQQRVNELLQICQSCTWYTKRNKGSATCGKCGCPVNAITDTPAKNKLALATESCPLDPPLWVAEV